MDKTVYNPKIFTRMGIIYDAEIFNVISSVATRKYQLSKEIQIARTKLVKRLQLDSEDTLDDTVIAIALECLINRL